MASTGMIILVIVIFLFLIGLVVLGAILYIRNYERKVVNTFNAIPIPSTTVTTTTPAPQQ